MEKRGEYEPDEDEEMVVGVVGARKCDEFLVVFKGVLWPE